MKNIIAIAQNTYRETIRDRILYVIFVFGIIMVAASLLAGTISLDQDTKIIQDFGLSGIFIFSVIMAIFIGTSLVYKEIDKRTIFLIISKPIKKSEFVVGKFAGLATTMLTVLAIMALFFLVLVRIKTGDFHFLLLEAIFLNYIEVLLLIALTIVFSTFTAPLASAIYALLIFLIGHSSSIINTIAQTSGPGVKQIMLAAYYIFPNLEKFNVRNTITYGIGLTGTQIVLNIIYALVFIVLLLFVANEIVKRQEF